MHGHRFTFRFDGTYRALSRSFGIKPSNAWVEVDDECLQARFGPWCLRTRLDNITEVAVTGPYRLYRTAGPARLGITDRGLTFATNGDEGVLITFATPVRGTGPFVLLRHPELTVTVADTAGLAAELTRRRAGAARSG